MHGLELNRSVMMLVFAGIRKLAVGQLVHSIDDDSLDTLLLFVFEGLVNNGNDVCEAIGEPVPVITT